MKKIIILITIILLIINSIFGQNCDIIKKSQILVQYFNKSIQQKEYQIKFFEEFPNSFECFNKLYGTGDEPDAYNPGPLYFEAEKHIQLFADIQPLINDSIYLEKVINICINGHWYADGVSYFKHDVLEKNINENLSNLCPILNQYRNAEILSFWIFYFDGPHPQKTIPDKLVSIKGSFPKIHDFIVEAHNQVLKEHDGHGK